MFAAGYLCRVLSRLHGRRCMVDNHSISNTNWRRVRGPRATSHRRGGCRRIVPTDRAMSEVLGRAPVILHVERGSPCHSIGKSIFSIANHCRATVTRNIA